MTKVLIFCLLVVGLINFLPVVGVLSAQKLESTYGISLTSNELIVLMRHRALLFGLLGGFILYSVFNPTFQVAAMIMAAISMVGFVLIMYSAASVNAELKKILIADYIGIAFLAIAMIIKWVLLRG